MKPFFKWAGGKQRLLPKYQNLGLIPPSAAETVCEPFCGGAAMSLHLQPKQAFLNDIATPVWVFWRSINRPQLLLKEVHTLQDECFEFCINRHTYQTYYNNIRNKYNWAITTPDLGSLTLTDLCKISAMFLFLNKNGYNGVYRVNSSGLFNVPVGDKSLPVPFAPNLDDLYRANSYIHPTSLDYKAYLAAGIPSRRSFLFVDPPYYGTYDSYTSKGFSVKDHSTLWEFMNDLSTVHDIAIASINHPDIISLYDGWNIHYINNKTTIGQGSSKKQNELLITNY